MKTGIATQLQTLQEETRSIVARLGLILNDYDSDRTSLALGQLVTAMENLRQAVIIRRASEHEFARHRAADPHCTCNDCIAYEQENQQ